MVIAPVEELIAKCPASFPNVIEYVRVVPASTSDADAVATDVPELTSSASDPAFMLEIVGASFTFVTLTTWFAVDVLPNASVAVTVSVCDVAVS